jgi:hypothetical protein
LDGDRSTFFWKGEEEWVDEEVFMKGREKLMGGRFKGGVEARKGSFGAFEGVGGGGVDGAVEGAFGDNDCGDDLEVEDELLLTEAGWA